MITTSQKIIEFSQDFNKKILQSKTIFLTPNSAPKSFYFLEKGIVRNFVTSNDGEELSINIFNDNTMLPLISFFDDMTPSCFFYESLNDVTLRVIPKDEMFNYLKSNFEARDNFSKICIYNINLLLSKTRQLIHSDSHYRIITTLITLAETLGISNQNEIDLNLSHEMIASFAGTTRETVTRKLNELKTKGFITSNYNSLRILKVSELKSLLTA